MGRGADKVEAFDDEAARGVGRSRVAASESLPEELADSVSARALPQ
jgi:hypothetical protein